MALQLHVTAGMKMSTSKTDVLHLSRNLVQCSLQVGGVSLKRVEKFKYLGVAFTSDGCKTKNCVFDQAKFFVFKSIFVLILTYGHESWVMTDKCDHKCKRPKSDFCKKSKVLRCLTNIVALQSVNLSTSSRYFSESKNLSLDGLVMPQERLTKQTLYAEVSEKRPVGRPRTRWLDYIEDLGWNRLGLHPNKMQFVLVDREVWRLNLELLPFQPPRKSGWKKRKTSNGIVSVDGIVH